MSGSYSELPDQQKLGSGQWFTIHKLAKRAITENKKRQFVEVMDDIREEMRCIKCKEHMTEYMRNNPFAPYWNYREDGIQMGLFKWTWIFHNSVNERLGKPYVPWEVAKKMYYSNNDQITTQTSKFSCKNGACGDNSFKSINNPDFSVVRALNKTKLPEQVYYKGPYLSVKNNLFE